MPTIYAATTDGVINSGIQSSWSNARGATTGTVSNPNATFMFTALGASIFSGRGAVTYKVWRSFFDFDTSAITSAISSATLKLYFSNNVGNGNAIVVHSTAFTGSSGTLAAGDFKNLDFNTPYSGQIDTSSTGLTSITLNSAALSYMQNNDKLKIAVINYKYDYDNQSPASTTGHHVGLRYANYTGTSSDPQIDYTTSSYGNTVVGAPGGAINRVNGILTSSISKVNGI